MAELNPETGRAIGIMKITITHRFMFATAPVKLNPTTASFSFARRFLIRLEKAQMSGRRSIIRCSMRRTE
jgi:hypothetical protein